MFQHYPLLAHRTIVDNLFVAGRIGGLDAQRAKARARELMERVGIEDRADFYPAQLSGGQRQRAAIAQQLVLPRRVPLARRAVQRPRPGGARGRRDARDRGGERSRAQHSGDRDARRTLGAPRERHDPAARQGVERCGGQRLRHVRPRRPRRRVGGGDGRRVPSSLGSSTRSRRGFRTWSEQGEEWRTMMVTKTTHPKRRALGDDEPPYAR